MPHTVRERVRLVEADGWEQVHQVGSHRQHRHPAKKGRVTIAGKVGEDVHPKTERSILAG